jgi:hypothetical protein
VVGNEVTFDEENMRQLLSSATKCPLLGRIGGTTVERRSFNNSETSKSFIRNKLRLESSFAAGASVSFFGNGASLSAGKDIIDEGVESMQSIGADGLFHMVGRFMFSSLGRYRILSERCIFLFNGRT